MTDFAKLRRAAEKALNYIENTESELGIELDCGVALREALTTENETSSASDEIEGIRSDLRLLTERSKTGEQS